MILLPGGSPKENEERTELRRRLGSEHPGNHPTFPSLSQIRTNALTSWNVHFGPFCDIGAALAEVRFVPIADVSRGGS